ncbi:MAG: hypothetical protein FOGNACKC_03424 [Anaerolineae bacterium]|nr:hypothetical protein [Anaerolineae bacterium]
MVSRIKAINESRPKIALSRTVQMDELIKFIASHSGLSSGGIMQVLLEVHDAIVYFNSYGQGVKVEGLGTYLPNLRLDGSLDIEHRQDPRLKRDLNQREFGGAIVNHKNVGKSADELVALWNETHPDDPVEE